MNTITHTATFNAPKEKVFAYLANVENLPEWATGFCKGLRRDGDDYVVTTPGGEVFFNIDSEPATGVLDMTAGPAKDQTVTWPARVAALPDGSTLFTFTVLQTPDLSDEMFAAQSELLKGELENIRHAVEV